MATIEDLQRLDIRIGRVQRAEEFPQARKPAYKLLIDFGEFGVRTSSAQLTKYYRPEDLCGRLVAAVVNLPPRQVGPFMSEVLVLGACRAADDVVLLQPDRPVALGTPIA